MRNLNRMTKILPAMNLVQKAGQLAVLVAGMLFFGFPSGAQPSSGWQQHLSFDHYDFARGLLPTPDGGYLATGHTGTGADLHQAFLLKLDPFGGEQWRRVFGGPTHDLVEDMAPTSDGGFVLCGSTFQPGANGFQLWLVKVDRLGNVLWEKNFGNAAIEFGRSVVQTSDGGFAMVGRYDDGNDVGIYLVKTDADGNEEWSYVYGGQEEDEAWGIAETLDHQLVIVGTSASFSAGDRDIYLAKIALDGSFQWFSTYGGPDDELAFSVVPISTGGLLIGGATRSFGAGDYDMFLAKTEDNGNLDWSKTYGGAFGEWGAYLLELPQGGFALAGSTQSFNNLLDDIYLVRTDADGNLLWQQTYGQERKDIPHSLALAPDGGFLLSAHSRVDTNGVVESSQGYLLRTDATGNLLSNYLKGHIFNDSNNDCLPNLGEPGFSGWHLRATGNNGTFYGITDADGYYSILTDSGDYVLQLIPPNSNWIACENNLFSSFANLYDTLVADFPLQPIYNCPVLETDLAAGLVKPCTASRYQVVYRNTGTATATSPWLELTLDPAMTLVASGIAPSAQTGFNYKFDLEDLAPGQQGGFFVETWLDCSLELGRTHTLAAHIFPDANCLPNNPSWDGASIETRAACQVDSVRFTIKNAGQGDMDAPLYSIIVEDQIVGRALDFQLNAGDSIVVAQPVSGQTLRLVAQQSPNHPGLSMPTIAIEGCNGSPGAVSLGFVNMRPEDDNDFFLSIDGRESTDALLPAENLAFPKGIGNQHLLQAGTPIEYQILFKNYGEDSISTAVIQDTLSPWLDVTSVRPGAASHPYHLSVSNTGVLQFSFEGIHLPGSQVNDSLSVGFVKFMVNQMADAPADSTILNQASVSFDYGQPWAKPSYFHSLQKPAIISISDVSLCMGGLFEGVAFQSDTSFLETIPLPAADSLHFINIDVGDFGVLVEIDTFVLLGDSLHGWLLENDTFLVEHFDLGQGCDSSVFWKVDVLTGTGERLLREGSRLFPMPAKDFFCFETSRTKADLQFSLHAANGQSMALPPPVPSGIDNARKSWRFSTIGFPPGCYFLHVQSHDSAIVLKLVLLGRP